MDKIPEYGKRLAVSITQNSTWKHILHKILELSRKGFRNHLVQLLHVTGKSMSKSQSFCELFKLLSWLVAGLGKYSEYLDRFSSCTVALTLGSESIRVHNPFVNIYVNKNPVTLANFPPTFLILFFLQVLKCMLH